MNLNNFVRLTLQDYPGLVAAIGFTPGCQLRCPYCHNPGLALPDLYNKETGPDNNTEPFLVYLRKRKSQLNGVVVSGGEPLLQEDIGDFLRAVKELGLAVKLDTNGLLPGRLSGLISQGLVDYVALDYKNCQELFAKTVGLERVKGRETENHYRCWEKSLACLRESNVSYELRTTVVRELHPLVALIKMAESINQGARQGELWFLQSFQKSGPLIADYAQHKIILTAYSKIEMREMEEKLRRIIPGTRWRAE